MPAADQAELHFPCAGIDRSDAFVDQKPRRVEAATNLWARTTPAAVNVQGFDTGGGRLRGGMRAALAKYIPTAFVADFVVQGLNVVVSVGGTPVQSSQSGRVVTLVEVAQGGVGYSVAGSNAWSTAANLTGATPPLNYSGIVQSATLNQKMYFADGTNYCFYDPSDNAVHAWTASAGTLPVDSANNTPRLIAAWRGRMVLSGLLKDGQNIFFSAVGDATDFDYATESNAVTQAVALNLGPTGQVGDIVTAIIPLTDDVLLIGTDHEIHMLSGDPADGGKIDLLTKAIGIAWGQAHCQDPYGTVYFFSNKAGIYSLRPGEMPVRISQPIESTVQAVNTGANVITLGWDDKFQVLRVFITPLSSPGPTTHLVWEQRTGAWWEVVHGNANHDPGCVCQFDGNLPGDRALLIGSWDGYVRTYSASATDDDGTTIASSVVIGPFVTKDFDELMLHELVADLAETSGAVSASVLVGRTAEAALSATPIALGTWSAGRNSATPVRRAGHGVYVKLTATVAWALERIRGRLSTLGKARARSR